MPDSIVKLEGRPLVYAGRHSITRETQDRFKIYLPKTMNPLWETLRGKKVKVWLVVDDS